MSFPVIKFSEILSELSDNQEGRLSGRQKEKIKILIDEGATLTVVKIFENILLDALEFQKVVLLNK
jgi:hypothetical protein